MIEIKEPKYEKDKPCLSCHSKGEIYELCIRHDECNSTVITLCRNCLFKLQNEIIGILNPLFELPKKSFNLEDEFRKLEIKEFTPREYNRSLTYDCVSKEIEMIVNMSKIYPNTIYFTEESTKQFMENIENESITKEQFFEAYKNVFLKNEYKDEFNLVQFIKDNLIIKKFNKEELNCYLMYDNEKFNYFYEYEDYQYQLYFEETNIKKVVNELNNRNITKKQLEKVFKELEWL